MSAQHILVPLDFSEQSQHVLDYAIDLADKLEARLTVLHVIQRPVFGPGMGMEPVYGAYMEQAEPIANQNVSNAVEHVREAGVACEGEVDAGTPFQQIVDMAVNKQVDLIVIGAHGHTGLAHLLLGSVAERVIRLAPCPVLVVRSR